MSNEANLILFVLRSMIHTRFAVINCPTYHSVCSIFSSSIGIVENKLLGITRNLKEKFWRPSAVFHLFVGLIRIYIQISNLLDLVYFGINVNPIFIQNVTGISILIASHMLLFFRKIILT